MKYLIFCFWLLFSFQAFGQDNMEPEPFIPVTDTTIEKEINTTIEEEVFVIVEDMPEFPGGEQAMVDFIYDNLNYPTVAQKNGIEGLVVVSFIVNKDGSLSDIEVRRDIGGGCGQEAERVIRSMPSWEPGKQRGKPVKVSYNMPVHFDLDAKKRKKRKKNN